MDAARRGAEPLIVAPGNESFCCHSEERSDGESGVAGAHNKPRSLALFGMTYVLSVSRLLDFSVGEGFQFFYDLFQPAAALGVILLRR